MTRNPEPHMPYFDLLEAFETAAHCALCEMRRQSTQRHLGSLLYESVTDPDLRSRLVASRGFCSAHAEMLLACGDGLGTAILYRDQVEEALTFLRHLNRRRRGVAGSRASAAWRRHAPCPICEQEEAADALRVGTLLKHLDDAALRAALESSPGLCVPHLLRAVDGARDTEKRHYLLDLHESQLLRLRDELDTFVRKQDYRHMQEERGTDADSWRRAPRMLLGGP